MIIIEVINIGSNHHNRDCAIALLKKFFTDIRNINPEFIYCAPHIIGGRDIAGMWDCDIWLPEISKNIRVACSSHANKATTIREHDLTNKSKYILHPCFDYYLVTWRVIKHKMTYRFYRLPNLTEIYSNIFE